MAHSKDSSWKSPSSSNQGRPFNPAVGSPSSTKPTNSYASPGSSASGGSFKSPGSAFSSFRPGFSSGNSYNSPGSSYNSPGSSFNSPGSGGAFNSPGTSGSFKSYGSSFGKPQGQKCIHNRPIRDHPGCALCYQNKETKAVYLAHRLKDKQGNITCPILAKTVCRYCGATGKDAHTQSYCPQNPGKPNFRFFLQGRNASGGYYKQ